MDVAKLVKFNTQTNARDKLCRLLQYMSKLAGWYVERGGISQKLVEDFKSLENSFSATRKVLRLGKSIDLVFGAYNSLQIKDNIIKFTLFAAKVNQAVYLIADHYIWLIKVGVIKGDAKAWAKVAAKFWLITIIFNLIRNAHDVINLLTKPPRKGHEHPRGKSRSTGLDNLLADKPVVVDTLKNCSDLLLPISGLNYIEVNVGLQGILGIISSLLAMLQTWDSRYKLVPA